MISTCAANAVGRAGGENKKQAQNSLPALRLHRHRVDDMVAPAAVPPAIPQSQPCHQAGRLLRLRLLAASLLLLCGDWRGGVVLALEPEEGEAAGYYI